MRGEAGLPRRVTPVGGPGTRDKTRQAPGHTRQDGPGHAKNKVRVQSCFVVGGDGDSESEGTQAPGPTWF